MMNSQKIPKRNLINNNITASTKMTKSGKKNDWKKKKEMSMDNVLEDSSTNLINLKDIKINRFKPPFIWNFPIERIRALQKKNNNEISTTNIDFKKKKKRKRKK